MKLKVNKIAINFHFYYKNNKKVIINVVGRYRGIPNFIILYII